MHPQLAQPEPVLIFGLFAVIIIVVGIIAIIQAKKRREAWQALAAKLGCSYSGDDYGIDSHAHSLFGYGHSHRASNVIRGRVDDVPMTAFDYRYKTSSGTGKDRKEQTHYFTCVMLTAPIPFQDLWIRPETFLDRMGEFVGIDDIDFESEEFSRAFYVKCPDKKFAYDVLHARAMELLLECKKIHLEAKGRELLFYYNGRKRVPDDVEPMIRRTAKLIELLPNYLLEQYGGGV